MNPRVKNAKVINNNQIEIEFTNNEKGIFDISKYLNIGIFKDLQNIDKLCDFKVVYGTIEWSNGADLCPDTIYLESIKN